MEEILITCEKCGGAECICSLQRENAELRAKMEAASEFLVAGQPDRLNAVYVRKCFGYKLPKQPMWKVTRGPCVLAKDGEWEYEPQPSSRDDEFYARCRYDTYDDAANAAMAAQRGAK